MSTFTLQKQQCVRDHAFDGIMEVQKSVLRFHAPYSLILYAATPTAPPAAAVAALSHAFHLFLHPVHCMLHTRLTPRAAAALHAEVEAVAASLPSASIIRLRKLLLLAPPHHRLEHIRLLRRDLDFPDDFAESIIQSNRSLFRLTLDGFVELLASPTLRLSILKKGETFSPLAPSLPSFFHPSPLSLQNLDCGLITKMLRDFFVK
ncbi:protein ROOT PRIMORDIUM DEFECTIVE 1-like [Setaria viridis]|uniref:protein ROOT PRIMORDIUM DEFECTIVE 1-like n=1 Tax=Setaria viridis TaxID=4556 RepID=UPI001493D03C|nr:protein ROOT PRIMORDIUM DEFECTIVE 1-like [Setaria viridis]